MIRDELITYDTDSRDAYGNQPIIDTREIVRCRDCDYEVHESDWQPDGRYRPVEMWWCHADRFMGLDGDHPRVEPDGFCAWGKRRGEE